MAVRFGEGAGAAGGSAAACGRDVGAGTGEVGPVRAAGTGAATGAGDAAATATATGGRDGAADRVAAAPSPRSGMAMIRLRFAPGGGGGRFDPRP
jgi:hypothetical protein